MMDSVLQLVLFCGGVPLICGGLVIQCLEHTMQFMWWQGEIAGLLLCVVGGNIGSRERALLDAWRSSLLWYPRFLRA
jgi:hypothetical protein